ncbi:MAG: AMP-binding protein [Alphaproteobacteria bacterium]|jgi:acyl-CoA synthetase (AMP-forming)/AMP-acid ligase II|nr:AMP-binding protein [Alphaproteobacteria bacterium]MDP6814037.1 AMP-binding protein [Alphaproteobacteria bacterium]
MINLSAFVRFHCSRTPEAVAVIYDGRSITWADLYDRVRRTAALLAGRGIGPDDVVAVCMKNSAAFIDLTIAASYLGAVFLPINYRLAADEVAYVVDNAGAGLLLVDDELANLAGDFDPVILLDAAARADPRSLAGNVSAVPPEHVRAAGDLLRLMYTSGTTAHPKGVTISYDNFYWKSLDHVMALGLTAADRLLVVGPLYHCGALDLPGLAVLWMGGTLCIHREFEAEAALASIEEQRLTGGWMAPTMTNGVLNLDGNDRYDLSSLKWIIGGGERTPEQRIRQFTEVFANARYIDAYGLTESVSGDTFMEAGREIEKIGSTGRALAHVQVAIFDDDGERLPAGREGEIVLRGPKITKGYWRDPENTAASFHGEWLRTGDVGYLDDDDFLYLTDRKKDMILSGGENIASSEVERVIYDLPQVLEAAVIGVPDETWGERPVAVVVPHPGQSLSASELEAHCRKHLAGFKVPKELHIREVLPRNPSGKVLKRTLRAELQTKAKSDDV